MTAEETQQVAARDTTFDNILPKTIWITHRSSPCRKYIVWYLEINSIEKEMSRFYVGNYDGILSESHQLSWILNSAEIEKLKRQVDTLKRALEFYADEDHWIESKDGHPNTSYIAMTDDGNKARQALAEIEGVK